MDLRLVTLNMRFGAGSRILDRPAYDVPFSTRKLSPIAGALESVEPDIVALQEVSNPRQAERLAKLLKMGCAYTPHPSSYAFDFFEWGLAFLYKGKLIDTANRCIHFCEEARYGRHALMVRVSLDRIPVTLVNVHLELKDAASQIENLIHFVAPFERPVVLMGDFNCRPDDGTLKNLKPRWADTCRAVDTAFTREANLLGTLLYAKRRVDYIFVEPAAFEVREAGLLPPEHREVSDHTGYFTVLRYRLSH